MKKIGIVLLNYLNYTDTLECIDTLLNQKESDFIVAIVDNGSTNDSVQKIREKIFGLSNFYLIETGENLGYAKGNNRGITFLKENFNIEKVLICNNDVLFIDDKFLEKLSKIEYTTNVGAIGTTIIGSDGLNQNPTKWDYSFEGIKKQTDYYEKKYVQLYKVIKKRIVSTSIGTRLKKLKNLYVGKQVISTYNKNHILDSDELLHGSVILLTENYLKIFPGFYPETFLYGEEMILKIIFNKLNLDMLYIHNLKIEHKEDQSSALSFDNDSKVMSRYQYESNKIILNMYNKDIKTISLKLKNNLTGGQGF